MIEIEQRKKKKKIYLRENVIFEVESPISNEKRVGR
jgi:hypothetical protein